MAIVNNQSELQAAIAAHDSFIQVDTDITLTARLVIRYAVVISSIDSANVRTIFKGESFFGNMFSILYSLAGGLLSFLVMYLLKRMKWFGVLPVSVSGGIFHNVGQLIVAAYVVENYNIFYYMPVLLFAGALTGFLIGIAAQEMIKRIGNRMV